MKEIKKSKNYFFNLVIFKFFIGESINLLKLNQNKINFFSKIFFFKPFSLNAKFKYVKTYLRNFYFFRFLNLLKNKFKKKFRFLNLNFKNRKKKQIRGFKNYFKSKIKIKKFNL